MQGLLCLDDHRRRKGKGINLCLLLFKRKFIALYELRIDTADLAVFLTSIIYNKENAAVLRVVLLQCLLDRSILTAFHRKLLS
mgnify:CR=1 FL=1